MSTYRRIATELRLQIQQDDLAELPTEHELAQKYGVARGTARAALEKLQAEGLIEVVHGQRRRVAGDDRFPDTRWGRIASDLRAGLVAGKYPLDEPLPSESQLILSYGVSKNTVRRAYRELVARRLVEVVHGAGAFPRGP